MLLILTVTAALLFFAVILFVVKIPLIISLFSVFGFLFILDPPRHDETLEKGETDYESFTGIESSASEQ